jgi:hypothetical protein
MFQAKVVEKIKTHILCSVTFFFVSKNRAVYKKIWKNITERGRPQMTLQYGACALHAGYQRLQIHTNVV